MNKTKILITGANGYVGARCYIDLVSDEKYVVLGLAGKNKIFKEQLEIDLLDTNQLEKAILNFKPDIIIHTAANAYPQECENNPQQARRINVDVTKNIVDLCKNMGIKLIFISTIHCYNPQTVYAYTKLEAEKYVQTLTDYVILRLSNVVGVSPNTTSDNLFNRILNSIINQTDFEAYSSDPLEVTYLGNLVEILSCIIERNISGVIIPVTVKGKITRPQLAKSLIIPDATSPYGIKVVEVEVDIKKSFDYEFVHDIFDLPSIDIDQAINYIIKEIDLEIKNIGLRKY